MTMDMSRILDDVPMSMLSFRGLPSDATYERPMSIGGSARLKFPVHGSVIPVSSL